MASKSVLKTTFEPGRAIEPIYTGGSVALSQDGQILATCVGEDALLIDLNTGERIARIEGDGEAITTLSLTPSASHIIISSRSLTVRIYNLRKTEESGIVAQLARTLKPHASPVITSRIDQTGSLLATGAADGIVKVWDIRGGFTTHTLHGHSGVISSLCFFETEAGTEESEQRRSKKRKRRSDTLAEPGALTNDDAMRMYRLASGSEDGQIRIWDLQKRKCVAILNSHVSVVRSLSFNPQDKVLLSASRDKTVIGWDAATWKAKFTISVLESVESAGFVGPGNLIFTGGERGRVRLWSSKTGEEITAEQAIGNESEGILDILEDRQNGNLLSIHADQNMLFHSVEPTKDYATGDKLISLAIDRRISGTHDDVIDLAYVGGADEFLAVATNLEELRILSVGTNQKSSLESGSKASRTKYFGADVGVLKGHEDIIICLDVDWSGHWIATGAKDNTARLWRVDPDQEDFTCISTFTGHAGSLGAVALPRIIPPSSSSAYQNPLQHGPAFLITGSQDKTIKMWDVSISERDSKKSARAKYTRKAHDRDINALDVNHNSTLFASASQDRTVKIWSLEEGEAAGILRGHKRGVWSVKFAPKNIPSIAGESGQTSSAKGLILTGSGDKTVKIWSLSDYSCLRTFEGHTNSILKVLWMPTSTPQSENEANGDSLPSATNSRNVLVASAGGDGLVKLWDANTGELSCTLDNHTDRVWAIAVPPRLSKAPSATDYSLVSGGGDSVITFWRDTTASTAAASAAASTARVEQDQQLQNYMRSGSYRQAITLALALNHPARLLSIFTSTVNTFPPEEGSLTGIAAVDTVLEQLSDEQLWSLLLRVRDWNANAKTAPVAQKVLWALLKSYPTSKFTKLKGTAENGRKGGSATGAKELLHAVRAYTDRHYRRMEDLIDESYLVDYTLREMDDLGVGKEKVNGIGHAMIPSEDPILG